MKRCALLLAAIIGVGGAVAQAPHAIRTLIVGGGPNLSHNQVAIESNVRYVMRLLPARSPTRTLFADGDPTSKTVLYIEGSNKSLYRAPTITKIDGAATFSSVKAEIVRVGQEAQSDPKTPVLLYFTGHGSGDQASQYSNNRFDLWGGAPLYVTDLAGAIQSLPKKTPTAVVMVQCFSGAFGNLLFAKGDPTGPLIDQNLCGFFASVPQRFAAGCTPEVNEANYRDFTGYFFAALTGSDRLGKLVTGADYNHDGKVGMNEAYCYSLIHDDSIDTPVCTTDTFLRRFVATPDAEVFATPYSDVLAWAPPPQKAALEGLSTFLAFTQNDRLKLAFDEARNMDLYSERDRDVRIIRFIRLAKSVVLAHQLKAMPDRQLKRRYDALVKAESANPFAP